MTDMHINEDGSLKQINDIKKLKLMFDEMCNMMTKIAFDRETLSEIGKQIKKEYNINTKVINKVAKTLHKRNYGDQIAEEADFKMIYKAILTGIDDIDDDEANLVEKLK